MPLGDFLAKYGLHEQGDRSSGLASMYARQLSLFTHAEDNHNQHSPAEELEQEDSAISSSTLGVLGNSSRLGLAAELFE